MTTLWRGNFKFKITELDIREVDPDTGVWPRIHRRFWREFRGYYTYVSTTRDGLFGVSEGPGQGPLERFRLFIPRPLGFDGQTDYSFYDSEEPGPVITIAGGVVTDFGLNNEIGPVGLSFDLTTFTINNSEAAHYDYQARGWIEFGNPRRSRMRRSARTLKTKVAAAVN